MGQISKMTDSQVRALAVPGRYPDGDGLYLVIRDNGRRSWFLFTKNAGKRREIALGHYPTMGIAAARKESISVKAKVLAGEPVGRQAKEAAASSESLAVPLFGALALSVINEIEAGFKNLKHRAQWRSTLETYCKSIWNRPVDQITVAEVVTVLKPIWLLKPETARRVRGRMQHVLDTAIALEHRSAANPAVKTVVSRLLPKQAARDEHHAAMPYAEIHGFWARLLNLTSISARMLQITILTAVRSGETRGATWAEFDLIEKVWTIPAERMKGGKEHRVPLCPTATAILENACDGVEREGLVFPNRKSGQPFSDMAMLECLKGLEPGYTVHGFRSSFSDWAHDTEKYSHELVEQALAHATGNKVSRAYRRGDALDARRRLMDDWEAFVIRPIGR